jgi:hypothetical protein
LVFERSSASIAVTLPWPGAWRDDEAVSNGIRAGGNDRHERHYGREPDHPGEESATRQPRQTLTVHVDCKATSQASP